MQGGFGKTFDGLDDGEVNDDKEKDNKEIERREGHKIEDVCKRTENESDADKNNLETGKQKN
jgi:hypothetical protein